MRALTHLRAPDDTLWTLGHGDFIGRLPTAALCIDDGRISEAHAMVSLRGGELKLLSLRGIFAVDGVPTREVVLRPGLDIALAPNLFIEVIDVELPDFLLALEAPGLPRQVLTGATSVMAAPRLSLVTTYREDAAAQVWNHGEGWRLRLAGAATRDLHPNDTFAVGPHVLSAVAVALHGTGDVPTHSGAALSLPLRIVASFDTVHLHRQRDPGATPEPPLTLDGIAARIVSELVAVQGPVAWEVVAGEVWSDEGDRVQLRRKWDVSLARLRQKLRAGGVRSDLVRAGGTGTVELLLYPGDTTDDRT